MRLVSIAAVVIGILMLLVWFNSRRFGRDVSSEVAAMWGGVREPRPINYSHEEQLPPPARRYVKTALARRARTIQTARLRHGGSFRPKLNSRWLPIRGFEYFTADPPGFVWWGRAWIAPGVWVEARDRSVRGVGGMLVSAESSFTLADSHGPGMHQGALLRLLAEMPWLPTALVDKRYVTWAPVDDTRARATLRLNGREAAGVFEFGDDGLITTFSADRHRDLGDGTTVPTPWTGRYADYRQVDGMLAPHSVVVSWSIDGQDRPYARFSLKRLEFDVREPF